MIDASQPGLATLIVIFDVLFVYFEFAVISHPPIYSGEVMGSTPFR